METHIVKKNDTLGGIALKHGVTLEALLKANPKIKKSAIIHVGQKINIPNRLRVAPAPSEQKTPDQKQAWVKMRFDGKALLILSHKGNRVILKAEAISGLPAQAKRLHDLINKENRRELDINKDYTGSDSQNIKDAGPIPESNYTLTLTKTMSFDKTPSDGAGWGVGGWRLNEGLLGRFDDIFGGRSGFFLHHDGGQRGTGGCIGVQSGANMEKIKKLLIEAHRNGQRSVDVEVDYD
jgi:LysM repeat protein